MIDKELKIGSKVISDKSRPFVIAEIGSNFDQNINIAKELILAAKKAKADAVKFQLFNSETLYPDKGKIYKIFKSVELNPKWIKELKKFSEDKKLIFMASCFDHVSVDVLEKEKVKAYKIASSETTNLNLLAYIAAKKKPLFISTGMCDLLDVQEAIEICLNKNNSKICLLQCTSQYPLETKNSNLKVISSFKRNFKCNVGFSDHSMSNTQSITAIGLGANVFEKHITLDKSSEGPDHFYALEPKEFELYVKQIHEAFFSLGSERKKMTNNEKQEGRREGLYFSKDLKKGSLLRKSNIFIKRPALEIRSRYLDVVAQAKLKRNVAKNEPIKWEDIEF